MPYCPVCDKCLYSSCRKIDKRFTSGLNSRRHKALALAHNSRALNSRSINQNQAHSQQQQNNDWRSGGGIMAAKCGHLFHQYCLTEHISNCRTKGDFYGTTYNVLCPVCGETISNAKTLKIDIEAHFGILEEFFQDLYKLKYMNKELKRTLALEAVDIDALDNKIEVAKLEYEHVKTLKRSNELKCAAEEARIAKALEDATTCYRYREIEKQLLDENVNLEAVARRMENMAHERIPTTDLATQPSSSATTSTDAGNQTENEMQNSNSSTLCYTNSLQHCQTVTTRSSEFQEKSDDENKNALSIALPNKNRNNDGSNLLKAPDLNSNNVDSEKRENQNQNEGGRRSRSQGSIRGKIDISLQISVHSEWSLRSGAPTQNESSAFILDHQRSRTERLKLHSTGSMPLEIDSVDFHNSLPLVPPQISKEMALLQKNLEHVKQLSQERSKIRTVNMKTFYPKNRSRINDLQRSVLTSDSEGQGDGQGDQRNNAWKSSETGPKFAEFACRDRDGIDPSYQNALGDHHDQQYAVLHAQSLAPNSNSMSADKSKSYTIKVYGQNTDKSHFNTNDKRTFRRARQGKEEAENLEHRHSNKCQGQDQGQLALLPPKPKKPQSRGTPSPKPSYPNLSVKHKPPKAKPNRNFGDATKKALGSNDNDPKLKIETEHPNNANNNKTGNVNENKNVCAEKTNHHRRATALSVTGTKLQQVAHKLKAYVEQQSCNIKNTVVDVDSHVLNSNEKNEASDKSAIQNAPNTGKNDKIQEFNTNSTTEKVPANFPKTVNTETENDQEKLSNSNSNLFHSKFVITPPQSFRERKQGITEPEEKLTEATNLVVPGPLPSSLFSYLKDKQSNETQKSYPAPTQKIKTPRFAIKVKDSDEELRAQLLGLSCNLTDDELILPPPPITSSKSNVIFDQLALIVQPPPPMSAKDTGSKGQGHSQSQRRHCQSSKIRPNGNVFPNSRPQSPESTHRLIESLLRSKSDSPRISETSIATSKSSIPSIPLKSNISLAELNFMNESEDDLLKSVIHKNNTGITNTIKTISEKNSARNFGTAAVGVAVFETGAGDVANYNVNSISHSTSNFKPNLTNTESYNNILQPTSVAEQQQNQKSNQFQNHYQYQCHCLAAERFVKNRRSQSLINSSSTRIGVGVTSKFGNNKNTNLGCLRRVPSEHIDYEPTDIQHFGPLAIQNASFKYQSLSPSHYIYNTSEKTNQIKRSKTEVDGSNYINSTITTDADADAAGYHWNVNTNSTTSNGCHNYWPRPSEKVKKRALTPILVEDSPMPINYVDQSNSNFSSCSMGSHNSILSLNSNSSCTVWNTNSTYIGGTSKNNGGNSKINCLDTGYFIDDNCPTVNTIAANPYSHGLNHGPLLYPEIATSRDSVPTNQKQKPKLDQCGVNNIHFSSTNNHGHYYGN